MLMLKKGIQSKSPHDKDSHLLLIKGILNNEDLSKKPNISLFNKGKCFFNTRWESWHIYGFSTLILGFLATVSNPDSD